MFTITEFVEKIHKNLVGICFFTELPSYMLFVLKGGWISTSSGSGRFASYQGIRYAMPPTGSLRFKPPLPYELEEGNFDVSQISDVACPQQGKKSGFSGQEDCLMLNVYVPESVKNKNSTEAANLPVMVWIYGGGFTGGSYAYSQYNPEHLVTKEVIVVAMNYRLGALGFLSMGDEFVPGNAGFKDQILALSWVQENIANFGGDPGAVTIFGESAGKLFCLLKMNQLQVLNSSFATYRFV